MGKLCYGENRKLLDDMKYLLSATVVCSGLRSMFLNPVDRTASVTELHYSDEERDNKHI